MAYDMDDQAECPLCMEQFEMDDLSFFPCTCGYQICRFCWHRIRTDENGLCPACRKPYSENPADFKPLTTQELHKIKAEKKQKDMQKKMKTTENRKHLANVRVVQKNLVFVVGLSPRLSDPDVLKRHEYFGKFGKIHKVVINHSTQYAGSQGPSASAYVTYYRSDDALRAIEAVNNVTIESRTLKASLGTTKYCSHFMKNQSCPKTDCMYLHEPGDDNASFTKEQMAQGKHQEYEKRLHDQLAQQTQNHINRVKDRRTAPVQSGSVPIPSVVQRVSSAENSPPDASSGSGSSSGGPTNAGSAPVTGLWPLLQTTTKKARGRKGRKRNTGGQSPTQSVSVAVNNNSDDDNSTGSREPSDSSRSTPLSQSAAPLPAAEPAPTPPPEPEQPAAAPSPSPSPPAAPSPMSVPEQAATEPEVVESAPVTVAPVPAPAAPMATLTPPPGLAPPTPASTPVPGSASSSSTGDWLLPLARSATAPCGDATAAALLNQPTPPPEPEDVGNDDLPLDDGDDDLDFDPFEETKKGLHALLEREREQSVQRQQLQLQQQQQRQQNMLRLDAGLQLPTQQLAGGFVVPPSGAPPRSRPPPPGFSGPSGLGLGLGGLGVGPQQTPDLCGSKMLPFLNNNARNGLNGMNGLNNVNSLQGVNSMNGAGRPAVAGRPRALSPPGSLFSDLSAMMHLGQKPAAPPAPAPARPDSLKDWQGLQKHFPNINFSFGTPAQPQLPPAQQPAVAGGRFSVPSRHAPAHPPSGVSPNMQRYMSQPPKTTTAGWSTGSDWTAMDPAIVSSGQLAAPRSDSPPHWLRSLEQLTETGPMYPPAPALRPPAPAAAHWTSTPPPGFNPALSRPTADNL